MVYRFGPLELDEEAFELRRSGGPLSVQPKVLKLLLHLVRNRERVVPTEELLTAVWPDTAVSQNSLARAVSLARAAIGRGGADAAIANVARRGYRFRGTVELARSRTAEAGGPPYVGRARIRARLEQTLDAALDGRGAVILLGGEAGIGKTRTAELVIERARSRGAFTVTSGGARPWPAVLRALRAADHWAYDSLPAAQRRVLELATAREEGSSARVLEAARAFLLRAAGARPIAVLLDDLHAADTESLWLLEGIGAAVAGAPVAIVATCREDELASSERRALALERLHRSSAVERWSLEGLASDEIDTFVRSMLGRAPEPALVRALERQTSGNPLLLRESLRSLEARDLLERRRGAAEWESLLPTSIRHLIEPKLRALSAFSLELLACAAVLGFECESAVAADLRRSSRAVAREVSECKSAGLLLPSLDGVRLRFPHLLVREAVYAELVPAGKTRRQLHARAADVLAGANTTSEEALDARAHHACEAVPLFAPGDAAALAEAASEHAARRLDFDAAVLWAGRALAALESDRDAPAAARAQILLSLGRAQTQAQGVDPARVSYRIAADHARSAGRADLFARAALGFAHRPNASGHGDRESIALLEEALASSRSLDASAATRVRSRLAAELRYAQPEQARAASDAALAAARRGGDPAVLAQTLDDASFVHTSQGDPEAWVALNGELVRAARAADDLELELLGHKGCVTGLLELGDVNAVDRELHALERSSASLGTPWARWLQAALLAMRALLDGKLADAERHILASAAFGAQAESPDVALELQAQLAYLRLEQGRSSEIEEAVRLQVRRFPDAPIWRAALARVLAADDRKGEAARELAELARNDFRDVPVDRGRLTTLALASEVAAVTGEVRAAAALHEQLAPHARLSVVAGSGLFYFGPVAHFLGLLECVATRWDASLRHFEQAIASAERTGARVWKAHSELGAARVLLARGAPRDRARAAQLIGRAEHAASTHGWRALSAQAASLARESWIQPRRPPSSSGARRRALRR